MAENKMVFDLEKASDTYIDVFVKEFIEKHTRTLAAISSKFYKDSSNVSKMAFQEIMYEILKKACYSFVNNEHDPEYIESYLFSVVHKTTKSMNSEGKNTVCICPGCKYFSRIEILESFGKKLTCNFCLNEANSTDEKWRVNFHNTFAEHSRKGFRCTDCDNFIPYSGEELISCPYPNCFFVGNASSMKSMRHPVIKANLEIPRVVLDVKNDESSSVEMSVKDDLKEYKQILKECIDSQINLLHYKSNESTLISKLCMYQAFHNMIDKYPNDMISYLVFLHRNVRMQHKIFQEFVSLLEDKIPFSFTRNSKHFEVKSLLDENLCVFDGLSEFTASVSDKFEIPNLTNELYVGSRKGAYCKPYYIGKVVNVFDLDSNTDITDSIKEYSFFKINMQDNIKPNTNVLVKHLRIFPHYQMGGMVYLNRIRRAIVDKVYFTIHGKKRELER